MNRTFTLEQRTLVFLPRKHGSQLERENCQVDCRHKGKGNMLIITRGNMKIITEDDKNPAEEERGVWKIK